jgi:hypothetical protein
MFPAKYRAIALPAVAALVLAADLASPGWGKFPNPVFYAKSTVNGLQDRASAADSVDPADVRLKACEGQTQTTTITNAQAAMRDSLTGKSSVIAVQWLGSPACQLADGSYRWLLDSGLALDVAVNDKGDIDDAKLSR